MPADKTELRGLCDAALAQALDALALAGNTDRNSYVIQVLTSHVRSEASKVSLLSRVLRGNPFLVEADGRASE